MVAEISLGAQRSARFTVKRNVEKALAGLHEESERRAKVGSQAA
jgi:hypothetical protein